MDLYPRIGKSVALEVRKTMIRFTITTPGQKNHSGNAQENHYLRDEVNEATCEILSLGTRDKNKLAQKDLVQKNMLRARSLFEMNGVILARRV